jgi:hypothetical protein
MPIQITADGSLVFTYDDGLTATYVKVDYALPERVAMPELVGVWYLVDLESYAITSDKVEFLADGSGNAHYGVEYIGNFEWGIIDGVVLFKDFVDTSDIESAFIIFGIAFITEFDTYALVIVDNNGTVVTYVLY